MPKIDAFGALLHAKHAFMPNKLGYCGPDDRGAILRHLQESSIDDNLVATLKNFEAAYPFIHLIGKSNGLQPFDRKVTEAYWIGNELLGNVAPEEFYNFSLRDLKKKNSTEIKNLFLNLRDRAMPHHTFYVISTAISVISDFHHSSNRDPTKISEVMDNCRISWGEVLNVEKDSLLVKYRPLQLVDGLVALTKKSVKKKVKYDQTVPPFENVSPGDFVSIHWNFACEVLSEAQVDNIRKYTQRDASSTNFFLDKMKRSI
ncbi:MAG: hypothetical protein JRN20_14735 [Nitrososphaerota archaeon]|nr:hypothetical protein [Nitrososphaerota archaeon]